MWFRMLLLCTGAMSATFRSVWRTEDNNQTIRLQFAPPAWFAVQWEGTSSDETQFTFLDQTIEHQYATPGEYTIIITTDGVLSDWKFFEFAPLLIRIEQWGPFQVTGPDFAGCINLETINATDQPIFGSSLSGLFANCTKLNSQLNWDISNVYYLHRFLYGAENFNQPLNFSNTGNLIDMSYMLTGTTLFNQPLNHFDTSNVAHMSHLFERSGFNQPLYWNTAKVTDMSWMFSGSAFNSLIDFNSTATVTNMEYMFYQARNFNQSINFDTRVVTNMRFMFANATAFTSAINFTTVSKVTNMSHFLDGTPTSFDQNLAAWDVSNVVTCDAFCLTCGVPNFQNCSTGCVANTQTSIGSLACACPSSQLCGNVFRTVWHIDVSTQQRISLPLTLPLTISVDWGDGQLEAYVQSSDISHAYSAEPPGGINISIGGKVQGWKFDPFQTKLVRAISSVESWGDFEASEGAFNGCENLRVSATDQPIFVPRTSLAYFFQGCKSLNDPLNWDIAGVAFLNYFLANASQFNSSLNFSNTYDVLEMIGMFEGASAFNQDLNHFDTSSVTFMENLFYQSAFNRPLSWDTGRVSSMVAMFSDTPFNAPLNFSSTSNVVNMASMFSKALQFNQPLNFNTSSGKDFSYMFAGTSFNQPLSFDTSSAEHLHYMFSETPFNASLNFSSTSKVVDMNDMFLKAFQFDQPLNFNTSSVQNFNEMFAETPFNQQISFDTRSAKAMHSMFYNATRFNQPVKFNTTLVKDMTSMFHGATSFNQTLDFNTVSVTDMGSMFANTDFSYNLGHWDVANVSTCTNFCDYCGLPYFSCSPCQRRSTNMGWVVCNCPAGQLCDSAAPLFQFVWNLTTNRTVELPIASGPISIAVNWGDGNIQAFLSTPVLHTYLPNHTSSQIINITGNVTGWSFRARGMTCGTKMESIFQWPAFQVGPNSMGAFSGCTALNVFAQDQPTFLQGATLANFFEGCSRLNFTLTWNIAGVVNLEFFLQDAVSFNAGVTLNNMGDVLSMKSMFQNAKLFNQNVSHFNTSNVKNMQTVFANSSFNQPLNWDTRNVLEMDGMFAFTPFNSPINFSSTQSVKSMSGMFGRAKIFNQPLNFNTSNVTSMDRMFSGADLFVQNLAAWDVALVSNCTPFCNSCGLPNFVRCSPCNPVFNVTNGTKMCKCPLASSCVSPTVVYVPYSDTNTTVVSGPGGITVVVPPDPVFNHTGTITVEILPKNNSDSVIARVVFIGPDGPLDIFNLSTPIVIRIPRLPGVVDALRVCLGDVIVPKSSILPECKYHVPATNQWVSDGCHRTGITETEIECSCFHLTDFAAILPQFNQVPAAAVLDLNTENIRRHPTGIVAVCCMLFIFVIVFGIAVYRDRKEALVIGLKEMKQQKWAKYHEHRVRGHRTSWRKQLKVAFQLNHTWATLINRKSGTSFRSVDRTFVALLTVFASMSMSARFHSQEQTWIGRGEVILFSVLVCLIPSSILAQLYMMTGCMGFYEEWQLSEGIRQPSKKRCLNYRFPGYFRWVWHSLVVISTIGMILYILTMSLVFDQNPQYYCIGNAAISWATDWITSYVIAVFGVEPLRILFMVCVARLQEGVPLGALRGDSAVSMESCQTDD